MVNGLGLCSLLLHDVNAQEKRGDGDVIVGGLGCGWFMRVVRFWAPGARAGGDGMILLVMVDVFDLGGTCFARNRVR